jgi:hypothetical protein
LGTAISLEQDLGMDTGTAWCGASVDQFAKVSALISSQGYNVFSGHRVGYLQTTDVEESVVGFYPIHACLPDTD